MTTSKDKPSTPSSTYLKTWAKFGLKNDPSDKIALFLMADAVATAKSGQKTPEGFYNLERMLKRVIAGKAQVLLCGTCMDARGVNDAELVDGARRSTMDELARETAASDKVLVF
jgi:uncharacterized protein involved in oxidation of intracellular sulfur